MLLSSGSLHTLAFFLNLFIHCQLQMNSLIRFSLSGSIYR